MDHVSTRLSKFWRARSLRFWLATGMLMAVLPIFASATIGYVLYHHHITDPLVEVAATQRTVLQPLQNLQLALWDVSTEVADSLVDADGRHATAYRQEHDEIESVFDQVASAVGDHVEEAQALRDARNEWNEVSQLAGSILSSGSLVLSPAAGAQIKGFETRIDDMAHLLKVVFDDILIENERSHDEVLKFLRRSEYIAIGAFGASLVFIMLGVRVISRSLVSNMDELASAAMRVAAGDRNHHVEVLIPPELANVAKAFNSMTNQIAEQERALARAATTDDLTGLYNRREFNRLLADEVKRSARYKTPVGFIMIDIDHFKRFNDMRGHQSGDEALIVVAETVKSNVRDVDKVCRFGGEEIAVILPESDDKSAFLTAERVRKAVASQEIRTIDNTVASVTISLGVATCPDCGDTFESLLGAADAALYVSKEQGRNRVTVATPPSETLAG